MRTPVRIPPLSQDQLNELDSLYRTTKDKRVRARAQVILLAAEQGMLSPQIAEIVRETDQTVRTCMKRYLAHGIAGLEDAPRSGRPKTITTTYTQQLIQAVRQRPRSFGLPFSLWTLQRLADYMAEQTGIRVTLEAVRLYLKKEDIVLSRPQHKISSPDPEYEVKKKAIEETRDGLAKGDVFYYAAKVMHFSKQPICHKLPPVQGQLGRRETPGRWWHDEPVVDADAVRHRV